VTGPRFTKKQMIVLGMQSKGLLAKQIADEMGVSQRTVDVHTARIKRMARQHGLRYGRVLVDSEGRIIEPVLADSRLRHGGE